MALSNNNERLVPYDANSPAAQRDEVGYDVLINWEEGDLAHTARGDLQLIDGGKNIFEALARRISTTYDGYRRYIRTANGLVEVDPAPTYGSRLPDLLSFPNETLRQDENLDQLTADSASRDTRIEVLFASVQHGQVGGPDYNAVNIDLRSRILFDQTLETLNLTLPATQS